MSQRTPCTADARVATGERRQRRLTQKALQNAIETKRKELDDDARTLQGLYDTTNAPLEKGETNEERLQCLQAATWKYRKALNELSKLYDQDRWGDYREEARLTREYSKLEHANDVIARATNVHSDETNSQISQKSLRSSASRGSTTSSSARRKALAEVAAVKKQAEFDKLIAKKENTQRIQEAEEQRQREQQRAQYELDIAILEANKAEAVANAKLQAIEEAIKDEEEEIHLNFTEIPNKPKNEDRVKTWVNTHPISITTPNQVTLQHPVITSTPQEDKTIELLETFTATNQRMVSGLTRQGLPKCHPDVFDGEVTLFHPWRRAFKAMIEDADVSPAQEMNYLRNFTKGQVQDLVDNFRRRQHADRSSVLQDLWKELERRFGNTAAITNALLERLTEAAKFGEKDLDDLQTFSDLCADVDSQLKYLPGLACLNYPNVIRPIVEKLPSFLRSRWEKEIVQYANQHQDAFPGFHAFASLIQIQARTKNHPNVLASGVTSRETTDTNRVLNTNTSEDDGKHCLFHKCDGHTLAECKSFSAKSIEEKTEWILKARLCFRCLEAKHIAKECKADIRCQKCRSDRHLALLHKETDHGEEVKASCTSVCHGKGGLSCGKILLVDVFHESRPKELHRVYAIIDDQSNASLISPDLANQLKIEGPGEKYFLSTCSGTKVIKYGRRVPGLTLTANGKISKLPTLIECDNIPQDKNEIPTPEIARRFEHLKEIAHEIPALDAQAKVQILIGRDAPEQLKIRASKNGPKGAPWAQKLDMGWTISGQVCLNRIGGPFHITTRRTTVSTPGRVIGRNNPANREYEVLPCPNHFNVKESYGKGAREEIAKDVYYTTKQDDEVDLSWEDRKFVDIMERSIHKNENGNWVMPLPFRSTKPVMPNNREQAVCRFNSLLRTLRRKPQMEEDYFKFLGKVFDRGHAVPVPAEEQSQSHQDTGKVWYLPHFGIYHPKKPTQIRVVFDSSAEYKGVSLNKELMTGPDLANSLLGVLLRFRQNDVGAMCDVEQMFHSFSVDPSIEVSYASCGSKTTTRLNRSLNIT